MAAGYIKRRHDVQGFKTEAWVLELLKIKSSDSIMEIGSGPGVAIKLAAALVKGEGCGSRGDPTTVDATLCEPVVNKRPENENFVPLNKAPRRAYRKSDTAYWRKKTLKAARRKARKEQTLYHAGILAAGIKDRFNIIPSFIWPGQTP